MPSYTRYKDLSVGQGTVAGTYAVGGKGSEVTVINGTAVYAQATLVASFASASTAQTVYVIAPYAGNVVAAYCATDTANISAAYTIKHGSAGTNIATGTQSTAASVAGFVTALTLSTAAVGLTAGESISVARGVQGTTGASYVTVVIQRTA